MSLSTEAKVGSITILGLAMLAYMIVSLGNFSFGDKGYPVKAVFGQVNGLKEGNLVRYAGVEVGRVKAVEVIPEGVMVTLMINPGVKIPAGSKFSIGTDGLLGEKYVNISPPPDSSGFIAPGSTVKGERPQDLDQLVATADKVLQDVHKLVQALNDVLGDEKVKQSLKDTALNAKEITANLNALSASLARMAVNNEQDVNLMAANLRAMSGSLRDAAARVDKMLAALDNDGRTAADLRDAIHNLKNTSVRVEKIAAALEGITTDPETAENIKETLRNARAVSAKANKMLSKVEAVSTETGFEVLYNSDKGEYRSNIDFTINSSPHDFAVVGVSGIGRDAKTNLQLGRSDGSLAARAGVVESQAGLGVDAKLGRQMKLSVDVYDPNDLKVKLRTQMKVAPDTYLVGQTDSLNKNAENNAYFGIKRTF